MERELVTSSNGDEGFQLASPMRGLVVVTEGLEVQRTGRRAHGPVPCAVVRKPAVRIGSC